MGKQIFSMAYILIIVLIILALLVSVFVLAQPGKDRTPADTQGGATVIAPPHAVEVAEGIFSLGTARDVDGRVVEGFMFIDNKKGKAKPGTECGNGVCEPGEKNSCPADCGGGGNGGGSTCFSLFAKGARWKETEPYVLNTTNNDSMTDAFVASTTETSLNTWDTEVSFDIFGIRNTTLTVDGADDTSPDGKNEVMFENLGADDTIAFTIVWGIFIGPPSGRELVEWDAVFNDYYVFGDADVSSETVVDYQNIATHEFGHSSGLSHPGDTCTEETMFRFAAFNETKKRDLNSGDIAGINDLY